MPDLLYSPASARNKKPILKILEQIFPAEGRVLEIGSGSGQHVVFFAERLPGLQWQPTDRSEYLESLSEKIAIEGSENVLAPIELDVTGRWPGQSPGRACRRPT